jgi:hypothetical protein
MLPALADMPGAPTTRPRQTHCCRSHWPRRETQRLRADSTAASSIMRRAGPCRQCASAGNIRKWPVALVISAGSESSVSLATVRSTGYSTFRSVNSPS